MWPENTSSAPHGSDAHSPRAPLPPRAKHRQQHTHQKPVQHQRFEKHPPMITGPGDSMTLPPSRFQKKAFPFVTPQQALRRLIGNFEERARPTERETLRVIPFGGTEQVGLNCFGFEYEGEILIVDMGLQFPDQYHFGLNYSIPDLSYVKGKKVVGVAITHGHIDHIGAIPVLMQQLGQRVPLYATPMAYELIKLKQWELKYPLQNLMPYVRNKPVQMGRNFIVTPFVVDHSIPDSVGLLIETPVGRFVHTGDWKFDRNPLPNRPSTDFSLLESIGRRGVRALFSDSTNAHLSGSSISESEVVGSIEDIFKEAGGRVITATFSSIIDRVILMISTSEKFNRKVVLLGRSMNNYMEIAIKLGYARPRPGTLITMEEANRLPDNEVTICCTGAQGERYAALMRIATGESKDTALKPSDTIIFSSSVIPGNERSVQGIFDIISTQGPRIYQYKESEIHAGGHARQEDSQKMISLIRPEVYIPIYGFPHMLHWNAKNAFKLGYTPDKVPILKNGRIVEFTKNEWRLTDTFVPHRLVTVDGNMVWFTREDTLHDRHQLMINGTVSVAISVKTAKFQISSAGIPDLRNFPSLERKVSEAIVSMVRQEGQGKSLDARKFEKTVAKRVADLYFSDLAKEPIVLVNILDAGEPQGNFPPPARQNFQQWPPPQRNNRPQRPQQPFAERTPRWEFPPLQSQNFWALPPRPNTPMPRPSPQDHLKLPPRRTLKDTESLEGNSFDISPDDVGI